MIKKVISLSFFAIIFISLTHFAYAGSGGACTKKCAGGGWHDNGCFLRKNGCNCGFSPSWTPACGAAGCGNYPPGYDPCSPVNGNCSTGDSATKPTCSNGVNSSYTGAGANSCGTNPTCYRCLKCEKGEIDVTAASCGGEDNFTSYQYTNGYSSITCGECKDGPPDNYECSDGFSPNSCSGEVKSSYTRTDGVTCYQCSSCPSPTCNESDGYYTDESVCKSTIINGVSYQYQCEQKTVSVNCNGHTSSTTCYKRKSCSTSTVCKELDKNCQQVDAVFVNNGYVCENDGGVAVCGKCCTHIAAPWFQTVNGNLFAYNNIVGKVGYDIDSVDHNEWTPDEPADFVNAFLARQAGDFKISLTNKGSSSGLPFVNSGDIQNESSNLVNGGFTQRSATFTQIKKSLGHPNLRQENFAYFKELLNYQNLQICSNAEGLGGTDIDGVSVCKTEGNQTISQGFTINNGSKRVIFVEGNLIINFNNPTDKIIVKKGGYLAYIVKGNIIVNANVGEEIITKVGDRQYTVNNNLVVDPDSQNYNGYNQASQIEGVFIANGQIILAGFKDDITQRSNNDFVENGFCDKKLTLAGSFVGWGGNSNNQNGIVMHRSFAGCINEKLQFFDQNGNRLNIENLSVGDLARVKVNYPDYNEFNPVLTFVYRPDLVKNTPEWMKHIVQMKQEVN